MTTVKVLTHTHLKRLNNQAIRLNLNQTLKPATIKKLPTTQLYPISETLLHNDDHMRCRIVLNDCGDSAYLDMRLDEYNRLPSVTF